MKRKLIVRFSTPKKDPELEHKIKTALDNLGFDWDTNSEYVRLHSKSKSIETVLRFQERWYYEDLEKEEEKETEESYIKREGKDGTD